MRAIFIPRDIKSHEVTWEILEQVQHTAKWSAACEDIQFWTVIWGAFFFLLLNTRTPRDVTEDFL